MAFHGRCIVLDTHALFLHVHQFSFTCHGAGSMEKGKEGEGGRRGTNSTPLQQESLQGWGWLIAVLHLSTGISQQRDELSGEKRSDELGRARAVGEASVCGIHCYFHPWRKARIKALLPETLQAASARLVGLRQ